jgi:fibronectin type 3 domain-containing protein
MRATKYAAQVRIAIVLLTFAVLVLSFGGDSFEVCAAPAPARAKHSVTLQWTPSATQVQGYNVYRANTSGGPYAKLNKIPVAMAQYVDVDVKPGHTYFYVVAAVGSNNVESPKSGEIKTTVPGH